MGLAASPIRPAETVPSALARPSSASVARLVAFTLSASAVALLFALGPPIVEGQRPHAFEYLYRDLGNVGHWFARHGAPFAVDELFSELVATAGIG